MGDGERRAARPRIGTVTRALPPAWARRRWRRWAFPVVGIFAFLWLVLRVLPKPSRIHYPCQQVAAPLATGFLAWAAGVAGSAVLWRRARLFLLRSRYVAAGLCCAAAVILWWSGSSQVESAHGGVFVPTDPPNSPVGNARGIFPGRVVWVHDPEATTWDGVNGYWSDHVDQTVVREMCSKAIRWLSGTDDDGDAWEKLFRYFKQRHGRSDEGYLPGEKIAVKVNMVQISAEHHLENPGNRAYNSPQLVEALLRQLVFNAGVSPTDITVYDASRFIPGTIYERCGTGSLEGVRFVDFGGGDGRLQAVPDMGVPMYHADPAVPTRWLPVSVTEADYVINLAHLKGHGYAGVTLTAKNHFGSTWVQDNEKFWPGREIHPFINAYPWTTGPEWLDGPARPMGSYNPIVEHMGHRDLGEKTLLFMVDGLYAAIYQGASMEISPRWLSSPFDGHWTSSVFASLDGVAIDSVCLDFLRSEPTQTYLADEDNYSTVDDYLHEAALADAPPSGAFYDPEGDGIGLTSLGVHEHWNNASRKLYTRNLGTGNGIELYTGPQPVRRHRRAAGRVRP